MKRKYLWNIYLGATLLFSQDLAQQIINELQKHPYAEVAPLIARMQEEATHQPAPVNPGPYSSDHPSPEPPGKGELAK